MIFNLTKHRLGLLSTNGNEMKLKTLKVHQICCLTDLIIISPLLYTFIAGAPFRGNNRVKLDKFKIVFVT